jgi:hypothetical protein
MTGQGFKSRMSPHLADCRDGIETACGNGLGCCCVCAVAWPLSLSDDSDAAVRMGCGAAAALALDSKWGSPSVTEGSGCALTYNSDAESKMLACASGMPATVSTLPV